VSWQVLYTKPNFEIKVSNALNSIGILSYCPTYTQIKKYTDRIKKVERPLLPSYVLVKINDIDRAKVFSISGVVRYLFWLGSPAKVRDVEIDLMKNALSGIYEDVTIKKLIKGSTYNIQQGPLKGKSGKVRSISKNKIKLELTSLGIIVMLKLA
jgi:transcription antitermination factor NusG